MNLNYKNYLLEKLNFVKHDLGYDDLNIIVENEVEFAKTKDLSANSIYVVIKFLSSSITLEATVKPVQILVMCEENSNDKSIMLFNKFTKDYNWDVIRQDNEFIKQQYSQPAVLSNFNEINYGYRSVLYVTGTLYVMENIVDVEDVYVDDNAITPLSFNLAYSMSGNTQQIKTKYIASTVKSVSTLSISMTIPMISNDLVTKVTQILSEDFTGDDNFKISFKLRTRELPIVNNMKLISAHIITAPNSVPGLELGFMK